MRTYSPKASEIQRAWHVIDAEGMVLGRVCTEAARILRGKHKPIFAPHIDTGDHVIVINASKIVLTSGKADAKEGLPPLRLSRRPEAGVLRPPPRPQAGRRRAPVGARHAPQGPLGRQQLKKLKVYAGPTHPHAAQQPQPARAGGARQGPLREENR